MELKTLRYFLAVARQGSFTKAAESLYITQPTLSRQMADLEAEMGVRLFERGSRKLTLTEEGIYLRRRAEEMLALESEIECELGCRKGDLSGVITIGAAETKAMDTVVQAISSFRAKYPHVTFDIVSDTADSVMDRINSGVLDLGLLIEPGDIEKYDFQRLGIDDRCGILMSAKSPLAGKEYVTVDDLVGLPVVANRRPGVRTFYRNALGETYDKLNVVATFNLVGNAALFARRDAGYVFTVEGSVNNFRDDEVVFRPFYPEIRQPTFLIWKRYQPLGRAVGKFIWELSMLTEHSNA